jgi:hypothetical protein
MMNNFIAGSSYWWVLGAVLAVIAAGVALAVSVQ